MPSSRKKVIIRRFIGETLAGYLPPTGIVRDQTVIELLDLTGHVVALALDDVKMVSYVREFNLADNVNPERLVRRAFLARPRGEGLWVRLTLRSGEMLEGLAASDVGLLDALVDDRGLHLTPPDTRSNTQHLYIPRSAIAAFQVLAAITTPSRSKAAKAEPSTQEELFASPLPPNSRPN